MIPAIAGHSADNFHTWWGFKGASDHPLHNLTE